MKYALLIVLIFLIINSCSNTQNEELIRVENSIERLISDKYAKFDLLYCINREKIGPNHSVAKFTKEQSEYVIEILRKSNTGDINLQDMLDDYKDHLNQINLYNESTIIRITERLNHWSSIGINNNRVALIIDIRLCELDVLNDIYGNLGSNDYTFNTIRPVILESSNVVSKGEMYVAKIGVGGYDSTMVPNVQINDKYELEVMAGFGIYRASSSTSGIKEFKGRIILPNNSFTTDTLEFRHQYRVR